MLFHRKPEEADSILLAQQSLRKRGLEVQLSESSLQALQRVWKRMVQESEGSKLVGVSRQHLDALTRRGLIRFVNGVWLITELGKCVLMLAEAVELVGDPDVGTH